MPDFEARCRLLETENEELRLRIGQLEEQLGVTFAAPPWLSLTGAESKIFGALLARDVLTKQHAMHVLYGDRLDCDAADPKIVDVLVCKLRAKLKPFEMPIETSWGQGCYFSAATKARAHKMLADAAGEEAS